MNFKLLNTILLGVLIIIAGLVLFFVLSDSSNGDSSYLPVKDRIEIANEFLNNELYDRAIEMYESVIFDASYDKTRRANMLFKVAEIYKDDIRDYEGALSSYLLMRKLFPNNTRSKDIERGIIECLDNLGRRAQAQNRLEKAVSLGQEAEDIPPNQMVAKIGGRAISLTELHNWLNELPPEIARQYTNPEKKFEFLKLRIADQLLYDAAIRAGYDKKKKIQNKMVDMERQLLATAYYQDHVKEGFTATEAELNSFYEKNKDELFGGKKLSEVQDSVESVFSQYKLMQARLSLSRSLFEAEKVQFYPQNLGIKTENE